MNRENFKLSTRSRAKTYAAILSRWKTNFSEWRTIKIVKRNKRLRPRRKKSICSSWQISCPTPSMTSRLCHKPLLANPQNFTAWSLSNRWCTEYFWGWKIFIPWGSRIETLNFAIFLSIIISSRSKMLRSVILAAQNVWSLIPTTSLRKALAISEQDLSERLNCSLEINIMILKLMFGLQVWSF